MFLGIDEVGRGAVAGPVVLAGVMLPDDFPIFTYVTEKSLWYEKNSEYKVVRDSKKITKEIRKTIADLVKNSSLNYVILSANNHLIDKFGIGTCLSHLLQIIVKEISQKCPAEELKALADGKIKLLSHLNRELLTSIYEENGLKWQASTNVNPQELFSEQNLISVENYLNDHEKVSINRENYADDKYLAVALASNIAKVYRDELMEKLDSDGKFGWKDNSGYATKNHINVIKTNQSNQFLRTSFLTRILNLDG